jgi:hypothetical protein
MNGSAYEARAVSCPMVVCTHPRTRWSPVQRTADTDMQRWSQKRPIPGRPEAATGPHDLTVRDRNLSGATRAIPPIWRIRGTQNDLRMPLRFGRSDACASHADPSRSTVSYAVARPTRQALEPSMARLRSCRKPGKQRMRRGAAGRACTWPQAFAACCHKSRIRAGGVGPAISSWLSTMVTAPVDGVIWAAVPVPPTQP